MQIIFLIKVNPQLFFKIIRCTFKKLQRSHHILLRIRSSSGYPQAYSCGSAIHDLFACFNRCWLKAASEMTIITDTSE